MVSPIIRLKDTFEQLHILMAKHVSVIMVNYNSPKRAYSKFSGRNKDEYIKRFVWGFSNSEFAFSFNNIKGSLDNVEITVCVKYQNRIRFRKTYSFNELKEPLISFKRVLKSLNVSDTIYTLDDVADKLIYILDDGYNQYNLIDTINSEIEKTEIPSLLKEQQNLSKQIHKCSDEIIVINEEYLKAREQFRKENDYDKIVEEYLEAEKRFVELNKKQTQHGYEWQHHITSLSFVNNQNVEKYNKLQEQTERLRNQIKNQFDSHILNK